MAAVHIDDIDLTASPVNVLEVTGGIDNANAPATGTVFRNDIFFIGTRGQGPSFDFTGNIDQLAHRKPSLSLPRSCWFQRSASSRSTQRVIGGRFAAHVTLIAVKFLPHSESRRTHRKHSYSFSAMGVDSRFATHVPKAGMGSLDCSMVAARIESAFRALCFHFLSVKSITRNSAKRSDRNDHRNERGIRATRNYSTYEFSKTENGYEEVRTGSSLVRGIAATDGSTHNAERFSSRVFVFRQVA